MSDSVTNGRQVIRDWKAWQKDEAGIREYRLCIRLVESSE